MAGDDRCGIRRNRSKLIAYSSFTYWEKIKMKGTVHQLFTLFKKAYDSVTREISITTRALLYTPYRGLTVQPLMSLQM
jgi:hypothetical protein